MQRSTWSSLAGWPAFVLFLGLLLTGLSAHQVNRYNGEVLNEARERAVAQAMARIDLLLQRYQFGLIGARGAITLLGADAVDRTSFARYSKSRNYELEFPGARGFGFVRRVPKEQVPNYIAELRRRSWPDFRINYLTSHSGENFVIELVEPIEDNRAAIGLDIASESRRRTAALVAMHSGQATLTGPITLVQASGKPLQSFLMLLPAYADSDRVVPENVVGWTFAPIVMSDVLARLRHDLPDGRLVLTDVTDGNQAVEFYATGNALTATASTRQAHSIMGRKWLAEFTPGPTFVARLNFLEPLYVALVGALLTLLCFALAIAAASHRARQARLQAAKAELGAIVESSVDAIIGSSIDGTVTSWNHGAETLFGHRASEVLGRSLSDIIVPNELRGENRRIIDAIARNEPVSNLQTRRRHRDGSELEVSVAVAPIHDHANAVVGISTTVRDVSALVEAQSAVRDLNASLEQQVISRTAELETARRDLRTVLDAVPTMIAYWDLSLTNRVANRAYSSWFGMTPEELVGMSMPQLLGDELFHLNYPFLEAALEGEPQQFERSINARDGKLHHTLANYLPDVRDGTVVGVYVIAHDVSDLVTSRQALASALRQNDVLVRTINEQLLYSVTDPAGIILEVNDNFCSAVGFQREHLIGISHRLLSSGRHDQHFWHDMWVTISSGGTWQGEICNRSANGELRWFDTVIAPYFDENGNIERYVSLNTDVTDRLAADFTLRRLSALSSNVLRAASEMSIISTDVEGTITVFNAGAERMLGYKQEEMVGKNTPACLHDPDEVVARGHELSIQYDMEISGFRPFVYIPEREGAETREWRYLRKDGTSFPVLLTVTSMRDDAGTLVGFLGVGVDISQRKREEEVQRLAKLQAEQASLAKGQFVANMSHEIRTPMNAVLGMLELIRRTELSTRQREYIDKATSAGTSLMALLNGILDFSKIEADKLELDVQAFEVDELLSELATVLAGNNIDRPVDIIFDMAPDLPAILLGDRQRLHQVLVNLAGNALKFTSQGHVVVGLKLVERTNTGVTLRFSVSDTGIGIPSNQLDAIFDGFTQAEASTSRRFGGTGLGLAISARLVELMGGKLQVASVLGQGSRFWFDTSFCIAELDSAARPTAVAGLRILLIDGYQVSADILRRMIEGAGHRCTLASTIEEACEQFDEGAQHACPYDVVMLDQGCLPNELDAQRALVSFAKGKAPLILIGSGTLATLSTSPQLGRMSFRATLNKPVAPAALRSALTAAVKPLTLVDTEDAVPPTRDSRLKGMHLLVVEDNPLNRQVAFELLLYEGATVELAEGGKAGIAMATDPARQYDAILMDVQMPDVDGLEATRQIRRTKSAIELPIIAMTANASMADRELCIAAGMNLHIAKPFDVEEVVNTLLQFGGQSTNRKLSSNVSSLNSGLEIDFEGALRRFGGNADLYSATLEGFVDEVRLLGMRLERAQAEENSQEIAATTHALKGMALTVGANKLAQLVTHAPPPDVLQTAIDKQTTEILVTCAKQTARLLRQALTNSIAFKSSSDVAPSAFSSEEIRALLGEIRPLLESSNLRALDLADSVLSAEIGDLSLQAFLESVKQLRFSDALSLLDKYQMNTSSGTNRSAE